MLDILLAQLTTFGGPVLVVLVLVSIVATATTIFKVLQFLRLGVGRHRGADRALAQWQAGERSEAYRTASADRSQLSAVIAAAMLTLGHDPSDLAGARQAATQVALDCLHNISRQVRVVESVVQAAPMLGLLGTVLGMIEAFGKVSQGGGAADPTALANGIWIALTTTALGLAIAIPFYFISVWLDGSIENERSAMDAAISRLTLGR
jgi:biopolymer transport protein ExbB